MKRNPSHPIRFYDERETNDRSLIRNFKKKKEKNRKKKRNQLKKKRFFCEFDLFICCTYIRTYLVPTYLLYIHEVILSIISLKKRKDSEFFLFSPTKSRRGEEKKCKGKKRKEKRGDPFYILPGTYLPREVGFFPFFSKDILIHRYM